MAGFIIKFTPIIKSTMMKILKIGLLASAFAMLLISCKTVAQNSTIESITLRNTYGRGGFTSITATNIF